MIPKLVITAGLMVAQIALGAAQRIEGPRLDSLDVSMADYGAPLPRFWGIYRHEGCPIIWAEKLREKKTTSKGKSGGKYDEYKYYGTWAVAVADHQVDNISRIWLDKHVCYQMTEAGPISASMIALGARLGTSVGDQPVKLAQGINLRIYRGTEDQEPDPRIEAWCEDRYGANSAPAYRGVTYLVFRDIPLEKFGNRIPQIDVEAINTETPVYPYETRTRSSSINWTNPRFAQGGTRLLALTGQSLEIWDVPSRTRMISSTSLPAVFGEEIAVAPDGTFYALTGFASQEIYAFNADGGGGAAIASGSTFAGGLEYAGGMICAYFNNYSAECVQYVLGDQITSVTASFIATHYFTDIDGQAWACGKVAGENKIAFKSMPDGVEHLVVSPTTGKACAMDNGADQFVAWQNGYLLLIDKATWMVIDSIATLGADPSFVQIRNSFASTPAAAESLWVASREHDTSDLSAIRTISAANWTGSTLGSLLYDSVNHALIGDPSSTALAWLHLDRIGSDGVELGSIVGDVCAWCGVTDYDASTLDQVIKGYCVTQGSGRDMLEPLLMAHDSIARPHDFGLEFMQLGGAASGDTLQTADFVAAEPRFSAPIAQDTDLPRRVTINFADSNKDQQNNSVIAQRPLDAVDSRRELSIDMTTYVGTAGDLQPLADRYLRRQWANRDDVSFGLTAMELALEPGDMRTASLDDKVDRTLRCSRMVLTGGALAIDWKRDHPLLHNLSTGTGAELDGRDSDVIYVPGPAKAMVLDIPLVDDSHENATPLLYYGAGRYIAGGTFGGAVLFKADNDGDEYDQWNMVLPSQAMRWGYSTDALGDANPWLWDRGNSVNIGLYDGELTSVTEAAIDADGSLNLAYLGGELLNFATATLESDGSYTLTGLKRGRRGSEGFCAGHAVGDEFVLVEDLLRDGIGLSEVNTSEHFKGVPPGRELDFVPAIDMTFTGATLKPRAPCQLRARRDASSGDWTFTWTRRTRVGGAWTGGAAIPLSENSEAYELVIPTSGDDRTISATSASATWTSAEQTADYGAPQTSLPAGIAVYQMSDAVGRGFASDEPLAA